MATRMITNTVRFKNSFILGDYPEELPAGEYVVETEEEKLPGLSFTAYRRISTVVRLPSKSRNPLLEKALVIDFKALEDAQRRDLESE